MVKTAMPACCRRARHAAVMVACVQRPMLSVWMPARCANAPSVTVAW